MRNKIKLSKSYLTLLVWKKLFMKAIHKNIKERNESSEINYRLYRRKFHKAKSNHTVLKSK